MKKITEMPSGYRDLEKMPLGEILANINSEDKSVPHAVENVLPQLEQLISAIDHKMQNGGRLFYIGAGTSGRLGILDASECPPTFGVPPEWVIGLIAGGDAAIRKAVEKAEDEKEMAWMDLQNHFINNQDVVIGISASGTTPYVVHGLEDCKKAGILTGCITSNPGSPLASHADHPIEVITGPEFVTGSTRMKAGTAQKLILNMISTTVMIRLGRVLDNKMVDMELNNEKLIDRGTRILVNSLKIPYPEAKNLLLEHGSVRKVLEKWEN